MNNGSINRLLVPANGKHIVEGRSVIIRPISQREVNERYISWLNDPNINKFLEVRHSTQTAESVVEHINSLRGKEGCELYAIFTRREQIHIGNVSVVAYNPNNYGYLTFGVMIGDIKAQQLGLGGEALVLMMEYFFSEPYIIRIEGDVYADNTKSCLTLEQLGFKREGVLRKRINLSSGKITDLCWYGLLREEWTEKRKILRGILNGIKITDYKEI